MIPNFFKVKLTVALTEGGSETTVYVDSLNSQTGEEISWSNFSPFTKGFITIDSEQNGTNNRFSEVISFTGIDTTTKSFTGCTRGLSAFDDTTITANKTYHPVGADVILSLTGQMVDQIASGVTSGVSSVNSQTGTVVLDADDISDTSTTNKFATAAEKAKLANITVTQAVNLDTIESDTATNNAKVSNATHTGDVTGSTALTIANDAVTNAKMANMATKTYKGRTSASTGDPEDVSIATLKTDLALNNVDNTSDATKNSATATLTNKTIDGANNTITNTTGYTLNGTQGASTNTLSASTSYYVGSGVNFTMTTASGTRTIIVPRSGTIKYYEIKYIINTTASSAETVTINIMVGGVVTTVTSSASFSTIGTWYRFSGASSISVLQGDTVQLRFDTPAWSTLPSTPAVYFNLYIE